MNMGYFILDKDKNPVEVEDVLIWGAMFNNIDARKVKETKIGVSTISTVFLGLDHNFGDKGPPILFETMVFGGPLNDYTNRYATWQEAVLGHLIACNRVLHKHKMWHYITYRIKDSYRNLNMCLIWKKLVKHANKNNNTTKI